MGDDEWCRGGDGDLKDEVIIRIAEKGPPCEEDLAVLSDEANTINNPAKLLGREAGNETGAEQYRLILQNQCH